MAGTAEERQKLFEGLMQQAQGSYNYNPYAAQEYSYGVLTGKYPYPQQAINQASPAIARKMNEGLGKLALYTLPLDAGAGLLAERMLSAQLAKLAAQPGFIPLTKAIDPTEQLIETIARLKKKGMPPPPPPGPSPVASIARDVPRGPYKPGTAGYAMKKENKTLQQLRDDYESAKKLMRDLFGEE